MATFTKLLTGLTPLLFLGVVAQQFQINQLKLVVARMSVSAGPVAPTTDTALGAQVYSQLCADNGGKMENGRCTLAFGTSTSQGKILRDWTRAKAKQTGPGEKVDPKASGIEIARGTDSISCESTKNGASCAPDGSVKCPIGTKVLHRVTLSADGKSVRNHYRCRVQR